MFECFEGREEEIKDEVGWIVSRRYRRVYNADYFILLFSQLQGQPSILFLISFFLSLASYSCSDFWQLCPWFLLQKNEKNA